MIALLIVFVAVVSGSAVARPAARAVVGCTSSASYNITDSSGQLGCSSYANSITVKWELNGLYSFTWEKINTESTYDKVTISDGVTTYGPYSGTTTPPSCTLNGKITVTFTTDDSNVATGFTIDYANEGTMYEVVSGQTYTLDAQQQGGFVYFDLRGYYFGNDLFIKVNTLFYEGMFPPDTYVSNNYIPSLEHYQWTNTTFASGSGYETDLYIRSPPDGNYYIGVFLYGLSSKMTVLARWNYTFPVLTSGLVVSDTVTSSAPKYYQLTVPSGAAKLTIAVTRKVPGGYPVLQANAGTVPSSPHPAEITLDTHVNSYLTYTVNDPNPITNNKPNPGLYIIRVYTTDATSGYAVQAVWP